MALISGEIHIVLEISPWLRRKLIVEDFTYVTSGNRLVFKDNVLFWISHLICAIQMVFQSMVLDDVVENLVVRQLSCRTLLETCNNWNTLCDQSSYGDMPSGPHACVRVSGLSHGWVAVPAYRVTLVTSFVTCIADVEGVKAECIL